MFRLSRRHRLAAIHGGELEMELAIHGRRMGACAGEETSAEQDVHRRTSVLG
jgi:hypothetical protein